MLQKFLKFIWHGTIGKLLWYLYAPKSILKSDDLNSIDSHYYEVDGLTYKIVQATDSSIFTNRVDNLSLIVNNQLVPNVSWQFKDGKVVDDRFNELLMGKIRPRFQPQKMKGTVVSLLTGAGGNYNYYHWLYDSLPRLELCESFLKGKSTPKFLVPDNNLRFQKETLDTLGIDIGHQLSSKKYPHIKCDSTIITSHPNPDENRVPRWITKFLREKFLALKSTTHTGTPFVYISRADQSNQRILINEGDLLELIEGFGFQTYILSDLRFKDQVSLFANAKIVMGVHGAGFANLTFCNSGTSVIELFPYSHQPKMYASISKNLNLDYHSFSYSDGTKGKKNNASHSIFLNEEDLEKIKTTLGKLV